MATARPLRDVFADLVGAPGVAGDPAAFLRDQGHPALPDDLVAEAVVSYADTAPVEVAEHLAPYVTAHSPAGRPAPGDGTAAGWLELLGTAPDVAGDEPVGLDDLAPAPGGFGAADDLAPDSGLSFGAGAGPGPAIEPGDDAGAPDEDGLVDVLADPAELDERDDPAVWTPSGPEADLTADLTAEESEGDDGEPG